MSKEGEAARLEDIHVHQVYEKIAAHFSLTRHKPWPVAERFLRELPAGWVGLDVGCGNGKYMALNKHIYMLASDRSINLASIASGRKQHDVVVADSMYLPHPGSRFDFAICIAVIHHISTATRRKQAIRAVLETLKHGGRCLFFVWALEQKSSRRGWDESSDQDIMVPWVTKSKSGIGEAMQPVMRYYHLYRAGELEHDIHAAGGTVIEAGYDRDNWWAIATQ